MDRKRTEVIFGATSRIAREYVSFLVNIRQIPVLLFSRSGERSQFPDSPLIQGHVQHDLTSSDWSNVAQALKKVRNPRFVYLATRNNVQLRQNSHGGTRAEYNQVNVIPLHKIIGLATEKRSDVIYISTDLVYGGEGEGFSETDVPKHPWGYYGHSKREGEIVTLGYERGIVIRSANVEGMRGDFLSGIAHELHKQKKVNESDQKEVEVWDNVENRSVGINDVCYVIDKTASHAGLGRVFHAASPDEPVSRYKLAYDFINLLNQAQIDLQLPSGLLVPSQHDFRSGRPARLRLETALTQTTLGYHPTPIMGALRDKISYGYPYLGSDDSSVN